VVGTKIIIREVKDILPLAMHLTETPRHPDLTPQEDFYSEYSRSVVENELTKDDLLIKCSGSPKNTYGESLCQHGAEVERMSPRGFDVTAETSGQRA
jgi:hypothetical protein